MKSNSSKPVDVPSQLYPEPRVALGNEHRTDIETQARQPFARLVQ
jgi:hypothetical protein